MAALPTQAKPVPEEIRGARNHLANSRELLISLLLAPPTGPENAAVQKMLRQAVDDMVLVENRLISLIYHLEHGTAPGGA